MCAEYQILDGPDAPWNEDGELNEEECRECGDKYYVLSPTQLSIDCCADHLDLSLKSERKIIVDLYQRNYKELVKIKADLENANKVICKMAETIAHMEMRNLKNKSLFDEIYGLAQEAENCLKEKNNG